MELNIICAVAENGAIGNKNDLVYHLRADLRRFKQLTTGHTVLMGRRTFESLPKGALPNRRNIVLTRSRSFAAPGAEVFPSLAEALAACAADEEVFVIGGASVYREALPLADRLLLTHIHATPPEADTFVPEVRWEEWRLVREEGHEADEQNPQDYTFADYEKSKQADE